jgi:hypothetical protein
MDDLSKNEPSSPPPSSGERAIVIDSPTVQRRRRRKFLIRRLYVLLSVSLAAFAFTTWNLVRIDMPGGVAGDPASPTSIVRAQLDAIARGDLRAAYGLFSQKYRAEVPFAAFHQLIAEHPSMFRAEKIQFDSHEASSARAVLDMHILARDGEHYVARYTLVSLEGRWWIDDVHWSREEDSHERTTALLLPHKLSDAFHGLRPVAAVDTLEARTYTRN